MATIDVKISPTALTYNTPASQLGVIVDGIERVFYSGASNYQVYTSSTLSGSSLVHTYPDGAVETYSGFVKDNPGAGNGTASASGYELEVHNGVKLSYTGNLNLDYTATSAGTSVVNSAKGLAINDIGFALELPATDPLYNAQEGNMSMRMQGALNVGATYAVSGTIDEFSITGEKNLIATTIDGDFQVNGNVSTDGQALTHSVVSGTLTGYHLAYADGSHFDVSGVAANLDAPATVDVNLLTNPAYFGGDDTISVDLPSSLANMYAVSSGTGNDQITLKGGGGRLNVDAGDGNDHITLLDEGHAVAAGTGIDTVVLQAARADYQITPGATADTATITDKLGVSDSLTGVERIQFSDAAIALDVDGNGGQAYRLYQAAFARTPDKAGLGYWINVLDNGASLQDVAQGFVGSQEFNTIYGADPSNHDLVVKFYEHILHREPEQAGLDYWVGVFDNKQGSVADVLKEMSESAENKAGLIDVIGKGFEYAPYHG